MAVHIVGPESDFPVGSHRVVTVRNIQIGIFNVDGTLHALPNVCPHQFGPLCTGTVNGTMVCNAETGWQRTWAMEGEVIVCPWHALEFNVTTGQCLAYPDRRLPTWEVTVQDGQISILM